MKLVLKLTLAAMLVIAYAATPGVAAEIGIYFDVAASANCLPEVAVFPYTTTAYVVATNCSGSGGIRGWEAQVAWDSTLVVNAGGVSGQPINVRAFPEYMVGLAAALPDSDTVVLAQLSVIAFGPGGIFLKGLGVSAPDSMPAILLDQREHPEIALYRFGSPTSCVASIGLVQCPAFAVPEEALIQHLPSPTSTSFYSLNPPPRVGHSKSESDLPDGGYFADVAIVATILHAVKSCVQIDIEVIAGIPAPYASAMELLVHPTERLWGACGDTIRVFALGYDLDGCMDYSEPWDVPAEEEVVEGALCYIAARRVGDAYLVTQNETFVVFDPSKNAADIDKRLIGFEEYKDSRQIAESEIVVDGKLIAATRESMSFQVIRRLKGDAPDILDVARSRVRGQQVNAGSIGGIVRLYLVKRGDQFVPLHGKFSVQRIVEHMR